MDAASILPTLIELVWPGFGSIRVVRVLRLLRVFRVLNMAGFMADADDLTMALWAARRKIVLFLGTVLVMVTLLGTVM